MVGLGERARSTWRQLSGGEQQRLSLALALAGAPEVLFLDEPTASVDVAGRQQVRSLLRSLRDEGCCIVLTTHELDEAERLADRVVIVDGGRVVATGHPGELSRALPPRRSASALRRGSTWPAWAPPSARWCGRTAPASTWSPAGPTPAVVAELTAWLAAHDIPLADLRAGRRRLEDVFLALTSRPGPPPVAPTPAAARRSRRRGRNPA